MERSALELAGRFGMRTPSGEEQTAHVMVRAVVYCAERAPAECLIRVREWQQPSSVAGSRVRRRAMI